MGEEQVRAGTRAPSVRGTCVRRVGSAGAVPGGVRVEAPLQQQQQNLDELVDLVDKAVDVHDVVQSDHVGDRQHDRHQAEQDAQGQHELDLAVPRHAVLERGFAHVREFRLVDPRLEVELLVAIVGLGRLLGGLGRRRIAELDVCHRPTRKTSAR